MATPTGQETPFGANSLDNNGACFSAISWLPLTDPRDHDQNGSRNSTSPVRGNASSRERWDDPKRVRIRIQCCRSGLPVVNDGDHVSTKLHCVILVVTAP